MFFHSNRMEKLLIPARENKILIAYYIEGSLDEVLSILIKLGISSPGANA